MAERALNAILTDINTQIKTVSFGGKITTRGLCYLQEKDGKTFPLENTDTKNGLKISWDDKYPLQTYHRILDVSKESDLAQGFGANAFRQRVYSMRLVGIGSKTKLSSAGYEDNQEFAKIISDALPNFINSNEYVEVGDHEVIKQAVYDTEFAGVDHQKKYSMEGVAFWIDYTLRVNTSTKACVVTPTNLATSNVTTTSIQLDWTGSNASYGIERSTSGASWDYTQIATTTTTTYTDTELNGGTTYYYRVRVLSPGLSRYSNIVNATTASVFAFGNALDFDGTNDFVQFDSVVNMTSNSCTSLWFKVAGNLSGLNCLISSVVTLGSSLILVTTATNIQVVWAGGVSNFTLGSSLVLNTWSHLFISRTGAETRLYVDGVESTTGMVTTVTTDAPIKIMGKHPSNIYWLQGVLDEVAIWGTTTGTAQNATDLYNGGNGASAGSVISSPTVYYKLDESGTTTTAADSSGNGNNGTLNAFPTSGMWVTH